MALITTRPKGTQDTLPQDSYKWRYIESVAMETAENYGFKEIRTPVFEHTELFLRSVGDTTDIVQKEMYTFTDKGNRSVTLRPEGTAGVLRASIENGLLNEALPLKNSYITSCFRYEKPQAGRLRQFHQFGIELLGASSMSADAEVISLAGAILQRLEIENITLEINSIGCPSCRPVYQKALVEYFTKHKDELCPTCLQRLEKNPMRILDCKSEICSAIAKDSPKIIDYLCEECQADFEKVQQYLNAFGMAYSINPRIVRGLDYYTKTVFEFISNEIGAQSAVCAGGRYNGLLQELGGPDMGGIGFAMGLERLLILMQKQNRAFKPSKECDIYIAPLGEEAALESAVLVRKIREEGFRAETDIIGRSLKAQMKYANKIGAKFSIVIGDDELMQRTADLKNMQTGEIKRVPLTSELIGALYDLGIASVMEQITENFDDLLNGKEL